MDIPKTAYAENTSQAQIPQVARGYADDSYDLIIGHGFEFGSALLDIAPDYPKTKFFVFDLPAGAENPRNIEFVNLAYLDAAYAAGALAALSSDKKKSVGFVGGDNPTQQGMMKAFVAAAERTVPGFKGLAIVTATITTPPRAR